MFWRVSGLQTASPIDSILDRESYTLEELLDEDELIQECKSLNSRLTTFLKRKETVQQLVSQSFSFCCTKLPSSAAHKLSYFYAN